MSTWIQEREDMAETLKAGGVVYLNRKPYLDINDVFMQMCDDSMIAEDEGEDPLLCGIKCSTFDNTGSGALIAQAMSTAIENLLEAHEVPLMRQWEMDRDEVAA